VSNSCSLSITDCNSNSTEDFCDIAEGTSDDCNGDMVPDECQGGSVGAEIIQAEPAADKTLPRTNKNTIWLTFACGVSAPSTGDVMIQELLNGGAFGSDLSGSFTFTVLNTAGGFPRILKMVDTGATLSNRTWYAVRNTGSWSSAGPFEVHYLAQYGDADNNGFVNFADLTIINLSNPTNSPVPDELIRKDVNADNFINFADIVTANLYNPASAPAKPSGH